MTLSYKADEIRKECTRVGRLLDECMKENKCEVKATVISMISFISIVCIEHDVKYRDLMRDFRKVWVSAGGKIDE